LESLVKQRKKNKRVGRVDILVKSIFLGYLIGGSYFINRPEMEAIGFTFFKTMFFQGFAQTNDGAGVNGDGILGLLGSAGQYISCCEEAGGFVEGDFLEIDKE
jgi:hypothetical protein